MQFLSLLYILPLSLVAWTIRVLAAPAPGHPGYHHGGDSPKDVITTSFKLVASVGATAINDITPTAITPTSSPSKSTSGASCPTPESGGESMSVPQSKPSNAVQVPGNFVGFGFETAFINDYAVGSFSENLVNSVANRLGETVIIRIGGTSGDLLLFDPSQKEKKVCIDGDCPIGSSATYILGPSYFEGFKSFPNQHWSIQAPLGPVVNSTNSLEYISRAYSAAGADRVDAIAIGNEPDTYGGDYTLVDYIEAAKKLEKKIVKKLGLGDQRIFEILDTASGEPTGNFSVSRAFEDGIDSIPDTKYVAQHWYQSPLDLPQYGVAELQKYLMNHSAITNQYSQGYTQTLQYVEDNQPAVSYIISESGSALSGPPEAFQDRFGAALWYLDFCLYSMTLGVKRVDASHRPAAPHSFWVPDRSANAASLGDSQNIGPQVRGPYYAIPMLADFLGKESGAVVELLGENTRTAYALYDSASGDLSKIALVNLKYWSADIGGARGSETFDVPVNDAKTVTVKRLTANAGAHAGGYDVQGTKGIITWAGETWSYKLDNGNGSKVKGIDSEEVIEVCQGIASVIVADSEAVIVYVSESS